MFGEYQILYHYLYAKLFSNRFKDRASLLRWQDKQVKRLLKKILPQCPFYFEHYKEFNLFDWDKFPLVDKKIMMNNFEGLNSLRISKETAFETALKAEKSRDFAPMIKNITVGLSSGTSGSRGVFLVSPGERYAWAGKVLAKVLPGPLFNDHKIAFFLRANSNLYTTVRSRQISFEFFDLLETIEQHIEKLNIFKPTILIAPPSMLRLLAKKMEDKALQIMPRKIISVAEVLETIDEDYISRIFKQKLHQIYQATEGFLATTCEYGILHFNEDILVVQKEYIDKPAGKFIPIITDFFRTTQPIIRYRLNDIVTERKMPCPCGSIHTAIEKIEGRSDDVFYFVEKHTGNIRPVFPDFISRAVICSSVLVEEFIVTQNSIREIEIQIKYASNSNKESVQDIVVESFDDLFRIHNVNSPQIIFKEYIGVQLGQKLKRVRSNIKDAGEMYTC